MACPEQCVLPAASSQGQERRLLALPRTGLRVRFCQCALASALVLGVAGCDGPGLEPPFGEDDPPSGVVTGPGRGSGSSEQDAGVVPVPHPGGAQGSGGASPGSPTDSPGPVVDPDEMEPPLPDPMVELDAGVDEP